MLYNFKNDTLLFSRSLEQLLIDNLQEFLLELGRGFSFVARQKYIRADDEDFFIDLDILRGSAQSLSFT